MKSFNHKVVILTVLILSAASFAGTYNGGGGGVGNPYRISNIGNWQELMTTTADWGSSFILMADVNLAGVTLTPVGNGSTQFTGVFDGNGHIIRNIEINTPGSSYVGLFGYVNGGQIKSLGVEEANIQGRNYVGGLVGNQNAGTINACYATSTVSGSGDLVGGLVGCNAGTITTCYATGNVTATSICVGGLCGWNLGTINDCYAMGTISGASEVGGLVGDNLGSIITCYAMGNVTGVGVNVGGLVGYNYQGKVIHCYSAGKPTCPSSSVGGLCGEVDTGGMYEDTGNFWDTDTSEISTSAMGTGKTTVLMQTLSTFTGAGWDFSTTDGEDADWHLPPSSYPRLAWENLPPPFGYSGGEGTVTNPYKIASVLDWQTLMATPGDWSSCFIMTADISLAGKTVTPVGNDSTQFTGVFDGNGHIIRNIEINTPGSDYVGLFGYVFSGQIKNLGVEEASIWGNYYVGGLVGGNDWGTITDCYATGAVSGISDVGGLVGGNFQGKVIHCYSTGKPTGSSFAGGLCGLADSGGAYEDTGNFWDTDTSEISTSAMGTGKTTVLMQMLSTFTGAGWDFSTTDGDDADWRMPPSSYPRLAWENLPPLFGYSGGSGTTTAPYQIATTLDWQTLMATPGDWSSCFIMTADIDMDEQTMMPVGNYSTPFTSIFDGTGHIIRHVEINTPDSDFVGLFGYVNTGGQVKNLGVKEATVQGRHYVGGLVGFDAGTITTCSATGHVTGTGSYVGGLVGYQYAGTIATCSTTGTVSGNYDVGGLVGNNFGGTITDSYATDIVSGVNYIGGLMGYNYQGKVIRCYSTGKPTGSFSSVGGLCGEVDTGGAYEDTGNFWDTDASEISTSAMGTGKTTDLMQMLSTFTVAGWDFTNIWAICEGTNYPRLRWQIFAADWVCPNGVNIEDLSYFVQRWLESDCASSNNYCGGADMNKSGVVDMKDFALFASYWLEGVTP
ncbi:MAG: hypothetical protein NTW55_00695 [Planctomycetota bacterium]|nr:hypothetical protein [Planctomycetota bacterium]